MLFPRDLRKRLVEHPGLDRSGMVALVPTTTRRLLLGVSAILGGVFLTLGGLGFVAERLRPSAAPDLDPLVGSAGLGMTILAGGTAFATLVAFDASQPEDQRVEVRSTFLDRILGVFLLLVMVYAMVEIRKL